jgi:predicted amino acid-binding ACT domain protein
MADSIRRMEYFYAVVNDKPGQAAKIVEALAAEGVALLAFSGFPQGAKKSQVVFVPEDRRAFKKVAKKKGLRISKSRTGFLVQGEDRTGALERVFAKLAGKKINVTAIDAVSAGGGRFGAVLWVKQKNVKKASKALGAR